MFIGGETLTALNFPNVKTTDKALRLSWIGRLLSESSEAWKAIPNAYFNRYGGLPFLLQLLQMQLQHKKIRQQYFPFLLRTSRLL